MKKLIGIIVLLYAFSISAYQWSTTASGDGDNFVVETWKDSLFNDTIAGSGDSCVILDKQALPFGWEYGFNSSALSGDSAATVATQCYVRAYDINGNYCGSILADTIASAGDFGSLAPHTYAPAAKYKIVLKVLGASDEVVVKYFNIVRRRTVLGTYEQPYRDINKK